MLLHIERTTLSQDLFKDFWTGCLNAMRLHSILTLSAYIKARGLVCHCIFLNMLHDI